MSIINKICAAVSRTLEPLVRRSVGPDDVEWVVNDLAELGVRINGRCFFLYKGYSLEYDGTHDDGTPMMVRIVGKREFGECCHPPSLERLPERYTQELTYTEGLSFRTPADVAWKPMLHVPNTSSTGQEPA
jgi:hypothetical protein